jgi:hypothetical protein
MHTMQWDGGRQQRAPRIEVGRPALPDDDNNVSISVSVSMSVSASMLSPEVVAASCHCGSSMSNCQARKISAESGAEASR